MRRQFPVILIAFGLMGVAVWWVARLGSGPDVTGPAGAEVRVDEVPNPATDRAPEQRAATDTAEDVWALPAGFRQLLARDAIAPIYNPIFTSADESEWPDEALVIGVEINGDARAYPIGPLNRREMVIDTIGDVPVLVTW